MVPGEVPGGTKNGGCSRGASWDGPGRPLGCFWKYLGDPRVSPERSECCYFIGFRWFSEMSCFLIFFHRYLKAMLFS